MQRFLFWIQSPLAVVFGAGLFLSIPASFTSGQGSAGGGSLLQKLGRIDYLGATTLVRTLASRSCHNADYPQTTSLCLFLYGLSAPVIQWIPIIVSLFVMIAFVLIELYVVAEPIIPVTVLKSRGALCSCFAQLGIMAARWMVLFYTPAYALAVRGWSPASAGSILIPTNLGFAVGGLCAGGLHIRRTGSFWL